MNKFEEALELYKKEMTDTLKMSDVDHDLLEKVTRGLGPSIYNVDSSKVSCSDKSETNRVKENFLMKKLGLAESPELDAAIKEVCDTFGSKSQKKYRAIFYYLLVKKFGKESVYA
ncbi:MAG: DUF2853 family protein [Bacteroidia bacterium]|nr:DUF2853 family protein [Bacteroidia bacterium]